RRGDGPGDRGAARHHHRGAARASRHGGPRRQSRHPRGPAPASRTPLPMSQARPARRRRVPSLDPVTREIIRGALRAAQAHMEAVIERTAMSPFIREKNDYFAGILDARGRVVCGTMVPLFGNLMQIIFEQYAPDTMRPGDLYWYNDCYGSRGGVSHSPDMVFAAPVFHRGRLVAFSQTWGHFWDIGGMRAGSISPDATEIFHEGIIVPAVRIYREGVLNDEAFRIFLRNSRFPEILKGDIRAVLAGCQLGERRVLELFDRFGADTVLAAWAFFEQQCRDAIRKTLESRIPDGTYESEDAVDGDGMSGRSFHVRMRLTKEGGRITLDTRASDDQAKGPINFIMHESVPKLIIGIYLLSGHPTVLLNDGAQDAIDDVLVRPGSILQPHWPAALGNRAHTLARVQSNVLALLALATGGDVPAPNSVYNIYFLRGFDRARNEFFLCSDGVAVGYGARPFADGLDAIYYVAQKNYPAEFMEMVFPLRLRRYALHQDSGGPGRYRGGAWGHPFARPLERVRRDVVGGFVSVDAAREDYGVLVDASGMIDLAATEARRAGPRGPVRMFHRNGYFGPLVVPRAGTIC